MTHLDNSTGKPPKFPLAERNYFLNAVRYVSRVIEADAGSDLTRCQKICARTSGRMLKLRDKFGARKRLPAKIKSPIAFSRRTT